MTANRLRKFATAGQLCAATLRHCWPRETDEQLKRRITSAFGFGWKIHRNGGPPRWVKRFRNPISGSFRVHYILSTLSLEGVVALVVASEYPEKEEAANGED